MSKTMKMILIISLIFNLSIIYVAYKAMEYRAHINEFLDKYTYVVQEFSGRNRYSLSNEKLGAPVDGKERIVFIGSQLTENWDLQKWFPNHEVINRGISGQRMAGFILRFMPDVIDLKPKAVVIEFASYNFRKEYSLEELRDYTKSMATLARANNITPILTTIIPTRVDTVIDGYRVNDSLRNFNEWVRLYSQSRMIPFANFYKLLADSGGLLPEDLSVSHIELNDKGYGIVSEKINEILRELK